MVEKLEVTIDVIIHATEDISKVFEVFEEKFGLIQEEFSLKNTIGHFNNPIIILNIKLVKKHAKRFIEKFIEFLSNEQIDKMINEIEERTIDSRYNIRLDKQEFIRGKIIFKEKDAIKLKIHTPVYNKKDTVKLFSSIFKSQLD